MPHSSIQKEWSESIIQVETAGQLLNNDLTYKLQLYNVMMYSWLVCFTKSNQHVHCMCMVVDNVVLYLNMS